MGNGETNVRREKKNKMIDPFPIIEIITINVNDLNISIKKRSAIVFIWILKSQI